jgi:hypothetical protein
VVEVGIAAGNIIRSLPLTSELASLRTLVRMSNLGGRDCNANLDACPMPCSSIAFVRNRVHILIFICLFSVSFYSLVLRPKRKGRNE